MHGVGDAAAQAVLRRAGVGDVHPVVEQASPDPDPTLGFPHPEEPGMIDASVALATQVRADLVVALDPEPTAARWPSRCAPVGGASSAATRPAPCPGSRPPAFRMSDPDVIADAMASLARSAAPP